MAGSARSIGFNHRHCGRYPLLPTITATPAMPWCIRICGCPSMVIGIAYRIAMLADASLSRLIPVPSLSMIASRKLSAIRARGVALRPSAPSVLKSCSPKSGPRHDAPNSADKLYLVIGSVRPDTKHVRSSTAPVPVDGAGGWAMG
jgi:hypothetical protein